MALQASLVSGVCYPTVADAVDVFYSSFPVTSIITSSGASYIQTMQYISGSWKFVQYAPSGSALVLNYQGSLPVPSFGLCDPAVNVLQTAAYSDGMQIGWGIATAMFSALALIFIKRAFFR